MLDQPNIIKDSSYKCRGIGVRNLVNDRIGKDINDQCVDVRHDFVIEHNYLSSSCCIKFLQYKAAPNWINTACSVQQRIMGGLAI
jgi:hypothetical protein